MALVKDGEVLGSSKRDKGFPVCGAGHPIGPHGCGNLFDLEKPGSIVTNIFP